MTDTKRLWSKIIALDKQIDAIQNDRNFSARMAEYNEKVDSWIELADRLGTDADGVKAYRGLAPIVRQQELLF